MFGRILSRSFALVFVLFAVSMMAFAQDLDDVTISGKVLDSNGLAIVGANITATEINTGVERAAVTDSDGQYRLIKLKPGTYKIKAAAKAKKTKTATFIRDAALDAAERSMST